MLLAVPVLSAIDTATRVEQLYNEASAAEAAGDLDQAAVKYNAIIQASPRLARAYNNLGAIYFKQGRFADAAETLQKGLKLDPSMLSASALLGLSLYQMGDYAGARVPLERVVKANPADQNAELFLVNALTKLGEFNAAATHLQHLVARQPNDQQLWYLLGRVHMQLAEEALGKVNAIDPDSVWAHEIAAELDESMKNYDAAIIEWKKAEDKAPRQSGVHFKLGDLYWTLSQWDNAAHEFEAEKSIDPSNCMVDWKLGNILMQKAERTDEALAKVETALKSCPHLAEAHGDRGRLLLRLHREAEAVDELQIAARANPSEPGNHFLLAQAYRTMGQPERARSEMKLFSELEQKSRAATAQQASEAIKNSQSAH
jgi:tetratricopeptide (TPR) repeat protein